MCIRDSGWPPFTQVTGLLAAFLAAGVDWRLSWFRMILDPRMIRMIICSWSSLEPGADLGVGSWSSVCLLCLCFLACDRRHARAVSSRVSRKQAEAFAGSGSNPCRQLNRLLRRRPSCLSLCRHGLFVAIPVWLTFVLGGRFEGAAEFSFGASAGAVPVSSLLGPELRADSESP